MRWLMFLRASICCFVLFVSGALAQEPPTPLTAPLPAISVSSAPAAPVDSPDSTPATAGEVSRRMQAQQREIDDLRRMLVEQSRTVNERAQTVLILF